VAALTGWCVHACAGAESEGRAVPRLLRNPRRVPAIPFGS
jgi:hypothetical protein